MGRSTSPHLAGHHDRERRAAAAVGLVLGGTDHLGPGVTDPSRGRSRTPGASSPAARERMLRTGRKDTAPELALRKELHRRGRRYRVDYSPLGDRRRADVVFRTERVAIFVHGCFWHSCPLHATEPKANSEWWRVKLESNRQRDERAQLDLAAAGWLTIIVWEHEPAAGAADRIESALRSRARVKCKSPSGGLGQPVL